MQPEPEPECSICLEEGMADPPGRPWLACGSGHALCADCLRAYIEAELDHVRLAKTFGRVGCPAPACSGSGSEGGVGFEEQALCAALGGPASGEWRSFAARRAAAPVRVAEPAPSKEALMAPAPELKAVEAWLTFIEVALGAAAPPIRLWVCRGLGGGVDGRAGAASAGGLGVQLWPAALTLAARAAELGASAAARSACELGCGVGLAGLAWLHAR